MAVSVTYALNRSPRHLLLRYRCHGGHEWRTAPREFTDERAVVIYSNIECPECGEPLENPLVYTADGQQIGVPERLAVRPGADTLLPGDDSSSV